MDQQFSFQGLLVSMTEANNTNLSNQRIFLIIRSKNEKNTVKDIYFYGIRFCEDWPQWLWVMEKNSRDIYQFVKSCFLSKEPTSLPYELLYQKEVFFSFSFTTLKIKKKKKRRMNYQRVWPQRLCQPEISFSWKQKMYAKLFVACTSHNLNTRLFLNI